MDKVQGHFSIAAQKKITSRFFRLSIDAPSIVKSSLPGQFVHIRVTQGYEPFFRRPFSISRARKYLEVFYEVVGPATAKLSEMKTGESLDVMGPLGRPFSYPPVDVEQVVMIAGGIGIAPFLMLSDVLQAKHGAQQVLLYGVRSKEQSFDLKDFKDNGCRVLVSSEDGNVGVRGRVSDLYRHVDRAGIKNFLYTCGPSPMMASVQALAKKKGWKAEALLEERMACGIGTCLGCAVSTVDGYKTVCCDGPVFDLEKVVFEKNA